MTKQEHTLGAALMERLVSDSADFGATFDEWKLGSLFRPLISEIERITGGSEIRLAVGVISHDITEWHEASEARIREGASVDEIEMEPWWPNSYDLKIVTDKVIVSTYGTITRERNAAPHEPLEVTAMRYLSSVTKQLSIGEMQGYGEPASHAHLVLGFAGGSTITVPGSEESLTAQGSERLEMLIPDLYSALAG